MKSIPVSIITLLALALAGCGGGKNTRAPLAQATGRAALQINIKWPEVGSRAIPTKAQSILITVSAGTTRIKDVIVARPVGSALTNTRIEEVPVGTLHIAATAFPEVNATGTAQATGAQDVAVTVGVTGSVSVTLGTTITQVRVTRKNGQRAVGLTRGEDPPLTVTLSPGASDSLTATALDADNNLVLTDPKRWSWTSAASTVCAITPTEDAASVTAGSVGLTTLHITETESGKQTTVNVGVVGTLGWSQAMGDAQNSSSSAAPAVSGTLAGMFPLPAEVGGQFDNYLYLTRARTIVEGSTGTLAFHGDNNWIPNIGVYQFTPSGSKVGFTGDYGAHSPTYSADGGFYTVDSGYDGNANVRARGSHSWTYTVPGYDNSPPTLTADGAFYIVFDGVLHALDAASGSKRWQVAVSIGGEFAPNTGLYKASKKPAVGLDGTIYVVTDAGIAALNPTDGTKKWETAFGVGATGVFATYVGVGPDGTVYAIVPQGNYAYRLVALEPSTGTVKWLSTEDVTVNQNKVVLSRTGTVYIASSELSAQPGMLALNGATGAILWRQPSVLPAASAGDGTLYASRDITQSTNTGMATFTQIVALDAASGSVRWSLTPENPSGNGGMYYLAPIIAKDGTLYSFRSTNDPNSNGLNYTQIVTIR
ncbi:PQQ-binding-like beta-propeller repeat protein [Armatimonas sp.]|uniref:PQQ-binding-like beta-propeller repeat protein n=1 Tax=Armatimonas sp. TaxID=1872638 RepID=UPI00286D5A63|nr:PQQ-binding-like beta-propeller repeat protein [Armatimonas sp.]